MEPGEGRVEVMLGTQSLGALYRYGVWQSGVTGIVSLERSWLSGWTTAGFGGAYRLFGGYPFRLVFRGDLELGYGPSKGASLGLRASPGAALEIGKPWGPCASFGASVSVARFFQPSPGWKYGPSFDLVLSTPLSHAWRVGLGIEVRAEAVESEMAIVSDLTTNSSLVVSDLSGVVALGRNLYPADLKKSYKKLKQRWQPSPRK